MPAEQYWLIKYNVYNLLFSCILINHANVPDSNVHGTNMGPTWGLSEADRTQAGPMFAPWTLLSGVIFFLFNNESLNERMKL